MIQWIWHLNTSYNYTYTDTNITTLALPTVLTNTEYIDLAIRYIATTTINGQKLCDVFHDIDGASIFLGSMYISSILTTDGLSSLLMKKIDIPEGTIRIDFNPQLTNGGNVITEIEVWLETYRLEAVYA